MAPKPKANPKRSVAAPSRARVRDARSVSPRPSASASGSGGARARSRSRSPSRTKLDACVKHTGADVKHTGADVKPVDDSVVEKLSAALYCCEFCVKLPSTRESCLVSGCGCKSLLLCDDKLCKSHVTHDRESALYYLRHHESECPNYGYIKFGVHLARKDNRHMPRKVLSYTDWAYGNGLVAWPLDRLPVETAIQGEREVFHLRIKAYGLYEALDETDRLQFQKSTAEYSAGHFGTLPVRAEELKDAVLRNMQRFQLKGQLEPVDDQTNAVLRKEFVADADFRERVAFVRGNSDPQDQPVRDVRLESTFSKELVTHDTYAQFLMDCHVDGGMFATGISIRPLPDDDKRLFPCEEDTSRQPTAELKQRYSGVSPAALSILDAKATPDASVDTQIAKLALLTKEELASLPSDVEFRRSVPVVGGPPGKYVSKCPIESRFDGCPCLRSECELSTFLWDRYIGALVSPKTKPLDPTTKRLILFYAAHAADARRRATASASASSSS